MLAVHGIAICYYLGPSRTASLTFKCAVACAGYKFCEVLVKSAPAEVRTSDNCDTDHAAKCHFAFMLAGLRKLSCVAP